jgi:hypothetical protein
MFTLEQQIFIVQCFFSNRERLGSTRHLEFLRNFNKSFRTFTALNRTTCPESLQMRKHVFGNGATGSVLRKKGSRRPTKRSAENIEEGEQRIIAENNPRN